LVAAGSVGYGLGPAVIELDRRIRSADPLMQAATPVLDRLLGDLEPYATRLLCRLNRDQVMCITERRGPDAEVRLSYERGRPMPLLRGAPSKAILAYLPSRAAERLWEREGGGADDDWADFRARLARIRKQGVVISQGEVDPGVVGVAACVFDPQGRPIGAISAVVPEVMATPPNVARISTLVRASAEEISATLFEWERARLRPPVAGPPARRDRGPTLSAQS
jgi:DNA-binding IclR family transcriptional regulator